MTRICRTRNLSLFPVQPRSINFKVNGLTMPDISNSHLELLPIGKLYCHSGKKYSCSWTVVSLPVLLRERAHLPLLQLQHSGEALLSGRPRPGSPRRPSCGPGAAAPVSQRHRAGAAQRLVLPRRQCRRRRRLDWGRLLLVVLVRTADGDGRRGHGAHLLHPAFVVDIDIVNLPKIACGKAIAFASVSSITGEKIKSGIRSFHKFCSRSLAEY